MAMPHVEQQPLKAIQEVEVPKLTQDAGHVTY